jgi:8-oxo-dGTP pyrophosphatase MutT (NUDIX family)
VRECLEETGVAVQPLFRYPDHEQTYEHGRIALCFVACRPTARAKLSPRDPFRWIARKELPQYEFPSGNAEILRLLLGTAEPQKKSL